MFNAKPYTFGAYIQSAFASVPKVWFQGLVGGILAMLPGSAAMVMAFRSFDPGMVSSLGSKVQSGDMNPILGLLGPAFTWLVLSGLLFILGGAALRSLVLCRLDDLVRGRQRSDSELFRQAMGGNFLKILAQDLAVLSFQILISVAVLLGFVAWIFSVLPGLSGGTASMQSFQAQFIMVYLLCIILVVAGFYWARTKALPASWASVHEGYNSLGGMGRSLQLVRGSGFRLFWLLFVFELLIGFALSLVTGPFIFGSAMPGYLDSLDPTSAAGTGSDPLQALSMLGSMSWGLGLSTFIQSIIMGTLLPLLSVIAWTDLRFRKGETPIVTQPEPAPSEDEGPGF